ncbi:signal peptidase I [Candidatus Woesearchaeota archaeon]|nr:signal peptidase I [Candidatus Woesearchaeota archaeon]
MKKLPILLISVIIINIVLFGLIANIVYSEYLNNGKQLPYFSAVKKDSPQDIVKEDQIIVTKDNIVINIKGAEWSKYADTNSMEPVISSRANGLEIVPKCENIKSGDIIVYEPNFTNGLIVHRVINVTEDKEGLFFTLKGDNNPISDPEKVRCSQIKYQVIGIIY